MTAALQRSFSLDGKRVDFSAQTFPLGESPLDREALTPEQIAALHKVVAQAQLMATNLSYESMAGLTSLLKSISGLRQALKGTQTATIHAAASNLRDDLNVLKSANPNNPQLALTLSALKNIVPEKTKTGQVIRLAVVRDSKIGQPVLGAKITAENKPAGAKIIPFGKAAAQAGHVERLVPSKPSPLRQSNITGKADLSVLAKPELKKGAAPAKEPIGKADPVSGKATGLTSVDKKLSATAVTTQKDSLTTEAKGAVAPAGAKAAASGLAKVDTKQAVTDKVSLQTDGKAAEGKVAPANAKAVDGKTASVSADAKAAPVVAESKVVPAIRGEVKTVDSKSALIPSAVEGKIVTAAAEAKVSTTNDGLRPVASNNSGTEGLRQTTAAQPQHEARPKVSADKGYTAAANQSSQKSAPTTPLNIGAAVQTESTPIYHAPTERTSAAPSVNVTENRSQTTAAVADKAAHASTAYTAPASAQPPAAQNGHATSSNPAAVPSAVNELPTNKSEPVFKTTEPVAARPEATATPQNQAAQHQTPETKGASGQGTAVTGTQTFVDQNAGKPSAATAAPASRVVEPIIDDGRNQRITHEQPIREHPVQDQRPAADPVTASQPESPKAETAPINPANPIGDGVAQPINPPTNLNEEPKRNEFKQAAKGACAGCGGSNCAACMRPMSADTKSVKNRFAKLDKG